MPKKKRSQPKQRWVKTGFCIVVFATVIAYHNSFHGEFDFDDNSSIVENPLVQTLAPKCFPDTSNSTVAGRPVVLYTFCINYALGGLDVVGYHVVNLLIHIGAACLIFAIIRRTLIEPVFQGEFDRSAVWLATIIATLWAVHPLNTEAVTFTVQRAESMAALFYLLVIYCLIRSDKGHRVWQTMAVIACVLGLGCKEILATAPVVALLYDRTFLAGSFRSAIQKRWKLYAGLAATWIVLLLLILSTNGRGVTVGFNQGISATQYFRTQLGAIAHYLRLAFWPTQLVFSEYGWPIAKHWSEIGIGGWITLILGFATLIALRYSPILGFLGAWFFLILAPSSSFVPIVTEVVAEHRMYLPLVAVVTLVTVLFWNLLRRIGLELLMAVAVLFAGIGLTRSTILRNDIYRTPLSLWQDVVDKLPDNGQGYANLAFVYLKQSQAFPIGSPEGMERGKVSEKYYYLTLHCPHPWLDRTEMGLALATFQAGEFERAENYCTELIARKPDAVAELTALRGQCRIHLNKWADAKNDFLVYVKLHPDDLQIHFELGKLSEQLGDWNEAQRQFQAALNLDPNSLPALQELQKVNAELQQ